MKSVFTAADAPPSGSKYNAFGTFLETLRTEPAPEPQAQQRSAPARESASAEASAPAGVASGSVSGNVLAFLDQNGEQPAARIVETLRLSVMEFAEVLRALSDAELVRVDRSEAGEVVGITDAGRKILKFLALP